MKIKIINRWMVITLVCAITMCLSASVYAMEDDDPLAGRVAGYTQSTQEPVESIIAEEDENISFYGVRYYAHDSRFDEGYTILRGVDVSRYQKSVDWQSVRKDGMDFAIVRLGYRGYGKSGTLNMDDQYLSHINGASAAGLKTGVYFYSQATSTAEAREEARFVLNNLGGAQINLPIAIDFEYAIGSNGVPMGRLYNAHLSNSEATAVCLAFCQIIEAAGYEPMVYANYNMFQKNMNIEDIANRYKIWLAHYTTVTHFPNKYNFWQCSDKESVSGISGNVDFNFYYMKTEVKPKRNGWVLENGNYYWNENGIRQGTESDPKGVIGDGTVRGREIYDPETDGWYWLDACKDGAKAVSKEVWMPYIYQGEQEWLDAEIEMNASNSGDMKQQVIDCIKNRTGKWVRYDSNGKMYKGWYTVEGEDSSLYPTQVGNTYYYDHQTGLMAKGTVMIDGKNYRFNDITGQLEE